MRSWQLANCCQVLTCKPQEKIIDVARNERERWDLTQVSRWMGVLAQRSGSPPPEVFRDWDVNGDGYVSYPEFCVVMSGGEPSAKLKNAQKILGPGAATDVERAEANLRRLMYAAETTLTKMYLSMNRNRGGFVSPAELARIFKMHSIELSAEEQKMILKHYDTNKDGMINLAELHKALIGEVSRFEGHRARGQKRPRA